MLEQGTSPAGPDEFTEDEAGLAATPGLAESTRGVVLIAGSGRSGSDLMAGILQRLGLTLPEPRAADDAAAPEAPRWVVDFHDKLLGRANVLAEDAQPSAFFSVGRTGLNEANRADLTTWLGAQFADTEDPQAVVVADPRLAWFLSTWRIAAVRNGATAATIVMLRPPAEAVAADSRSEQTARLAAWVNVMLSTERATRGSRRGFVRYHDLIADWTRTVMQVGDDLAIAQIGLAGTGRMQEVHGFVEADGITATWEDLDVPVGLREVAQRAWTQLDALAEAGGETPEAHRALDETRRAYAALYADAEALAASTITAAGPAYVRAARIARTSSAVPGTPAESAFQRSYRRMREAAGRVKRRLQGGSR